MAFYVAHVYFHVLKYIHLQLHAQTTIKVVKTTRECECHEKRSNAVIRVTFETSFDSKQPKPFSALSETKRLFRSFRFYTETESFGVSIEPKQTEDQPKQFDREHILVFFIKFRVVSVCFETVLFVSVVSI
jgi:hypothetical protein